MGGKSSNTTSLTSIPPELLARYNAVNTRAEGAAGTPFQQYSQNPSAFVAPLTSTQTAGIQNTNQTAGAAQPFYGVGTGLTLAGAGPVNAGQIGGQQIGQYMSPFLGSVVGTTMANLRQQQQQEQSGELGNQISRGAFGGDRGRIAQANLARQQNLATGQTVSGLMNQGYGQALQTAQQQQGVNLGAEQANQARLMQAGQQIAGLGAGAQAAGLQGAQAQLAAGTAEQQTNQAGQTALYNQYLQQQGYPFQVAQFLANIAMGTGALSGQTTATQQPSSFFSDKRLKEDIEPIGETYDGQKIVKFRYKGEPGKQIGLIAQDVEKHHPEAVGLAGGYKTVDYDKATKHAADKGHYLHGGLVSQSEGGAVYEDRAGQGYAAGGETSDDMAEILRLLSPQKTTTPYGKVGLYGQSSKAAGPYKISLTDASTRRISPVQELALREPGYVRAPAFAHGGLAPDGYGIGGSLPYHQAEGEYVPEDISDMRQTPAKLDSPKSVPGKSGSDFQTAMDMAKIAAMFMQDGGVAYASGGLVPHMAYGGSTDFATLLAMQQKMYENTPGAKGGAGGPNIPQQQPQRRHEMLRPSPMPSAPTESGFKQLTGAAESGAKFGENAEKFYDLSKRGLSGSAGRPELRNKAGQVMREEEKPSTGLISSQEPGESGYFKQATDYLSSLFATGGLVPRHGYALDGTVNDAAPVDRPYNSQEREAFRIGRIEDKQEGDRMRAYEAAQKAAADATAKAADKTFREEDLGLGQSYAMNAERENMATARAQRVADVSMANEERKNASLQKKQGIENYFQNIPMVKGVVGSLPSYKKQADVAGEVLTGLGRGAASVGSPIYNAAGNLINFTTGLQMPTAQQAFGIGSVPEEFGRAVKGVSEAYNKPTAGAAADVAAVSPSSGIVATANAAPVTAPAGLAPLPPASYVRTLKAEPLKNEGYESVPADTSDGSAGVSADAAARAKAAAEAKDKADAAAKAKADADKAKPGLLSRVGDTVSSRDFLVSVLSGLGSMASSPSRYVGSAILQGLQGGVEASEALRKRSADIANTEAQTLDTLSDSANKAFTPDGKFVRLADGKLMNTYEWFSIPYKQRPMTMGGPAAAAAASKVLETQLRSGSGAALAPAAADTTISAPSPAAPASSFIGDSSTRLGQGEAQASLGFNTEANKKVSSDYQNLVRIQAQGANENTANINELVQVVSKQVNERGPGTSGTAFDARSSLIRAANTLARGLGGEGNFGEADTTRDLINKLNTLRASSVAANADQRSLGALQMLAEALPTGKITPDAAAQVTAQLAVAAQVQKDRAQHLVDYNRVNGGTNSYVYAQQAFEDDNRARYNNEEKLLKAMIKDYPAGVEMLSSGKGSRKVLEIAAQTVAKANGIKYEPGFARYFPRAQ